MRTVSLHAHVPEKVRANVWSGEYVDLHALLPEISLAQQDFSLTVRPGEIMGILRSALPLSPKLNSNLSCKGLRLSIFTCLFFS